MTITNRFNSKNNGKSQFRESLSQVIAVTIKNMVLLSYSVALGFPTILIAGITKTDPNEKLHLDMEDVSWINPAQFVAVSVGCILTGPLTHAIGRKMCMKLITIPFIVGWVLLHFSTASWQIFLAFVIIGLAGGLLEAPIITYVAEVTQPHLRGMFSTFTSITIFSGVLIEYVLGNFLPWRQVVLVNAIIPIISLILLFFVPETPIWLMMKNRPAEAKKSLAWLRGWTTPDKVEKEFAELWTKIKEENERKVTKSLLDLFRFLGKKHIYVPMGLVTFAFFISQFTGTTTIATYAVPIFNTLDAPINSYSATIILGVMQLLGGLFSMFLITVLGKRILSMVSLAGVSFSMLTVAVYSYMNNNLYLESSNDLKDVEKDWIPLIFLPLASFSAHLGIIIVPWVLIGEVFPNEDRAKASGIAGALGYICVSVSRKIFPALVNKISLPGILLFYSTLAFLGIVILHFILPETEGKTLYEISEHFSGKTKLDNKVKKKIKDMESTNGSDMSLTRIS